MSRNLLPISLILFLVGFARAPLRAQSEYDFQPQHEAPTGPLSPRYAQTDTPQKTTKALQGITFDSDYDNGSLVDIQATGPDAFAAEIYSESGELGRARYWFRFRILGAAGRSIRIAIDHKRNPRPVVRFADGPWRRMTAAEAPDSQTLVLDFPDATTSAEVAFFFPLGYEETLDAVAREVRTCDWATTHLIGHSHQGRALWMVTVTDREVPDRRKHRVWVHARAHSGESTASFVMLGFLRQVTNDSPLAHWLRQSCVFHIVPIVNADGAALGRTRWDSRGIDPEREWDTPNRTPEVAALHALISRFMSGDSPIRVSLNLHSTQGNYADTFFFKHVRPSVSARFESIQQRFIDCFDRATPLFDNRSPQSSQLDEDQFAESFFWNRWGEKVMAMTYEGHFQRRITDQEYITDEDYLDLGGSLAIALIEYFDLPPLPPGDPWGWVMF